MASTDDVRQLVGGSRQGGPGDLPVPDRPLRNPGAANSVGAGRPGVGFAS